jgi:hypothetical protein
MTTKRPLRASDLVPGRTYLSPSGRLCRLLEPNGNGLSRTSYLFEYLSKRKGRQDDDDGFALLASNAIAIAAMQEVLVEATFNARGVME